MSTMIALAMFAPLFAVLGLVKIDADRHPAPRADLAKIRRTVKATRRIGACTPGNVSHRF